MAQQHADISARPPGVTRLLLPLLLVLLVRAELDNDTRGRGDEDARRGNATTHRKAFPVLSFNYEHVRKPFEISLWILLALLMKLGAVPPVGGVLTRRRGDGGRRPAGGAVLLGGVVRRRPGGRGLRAAGRLHVPLHVAHAGHRAALRLPVQLHGVPVGRGLPPVGHHVVDRVRRGDASVRGGQHLAQVLHHRQVLPEDVEQRERDAHLHLPRRVHRGGAARLELDLRGGHRAPLPRLPSARRGGPDVGHQQVPHGQAEQKGAVHRGLRRPARRRRLLAGLPADRQQDQALVPHRHHHRHLLHRLRPGDDHQASGGASGSEEEERVRRLHQRGDSHAVPGSSPCGNRGHLRSLRTPSLERQVRPFHGVTSRTNAVFPVLTDVFRLSRFNEAYVKKWLIAGDRSSEPQLLSFYNKMEMKQAMMMVEGGGGFEPPSVEPNIEAGAPPRRGTRVSNSRQKEIRKMLQANMQKNRQRLRSYSRHDLMLDPFEDDVSEVRFRKQQVSMERRMSHYLTVPAKSPPAPASVRRVAFRPEHRVYTYDDSRSARDPAEARPDPSSSDAVDPPNESGRGFRDEEDEERRLVASRRLSDPGRSQVAAEDSQTRV
ncbi:sodium/hydrogen exchanger 1b isoform X2 [Phycodurus eques]|uniref:sodium/hydrogen exchanger 1b isoform X2 n=1 Tax=Phycodurus eques TaxID=693459 RepID=UPI002ACD4F53|nr:sodium/hydrogen exchanger 1b isoform X2 [Phycodurus eques]